MKQRNVLRERLDRDEPSIGTHLHTLWPGMVEVIGYSGAMDYVEFQAPYAPYDLPGLENFGRAVDLFDHMSSMIKIEQEPRTYLATRAVGSGIQNLLFADIRSPDDARSAVAAARPETPEARGVAGVGMRRDVGYVVNPGAPEFVKSLEDTVVAVMIEKQSAVEQLDDILSVGGIDMVVFGYGDYSMSIGIPGQWDHPKVEEAKRHTYQTALKMGIQPRAEIGDYRDAEPFLEMGIKHFCIGYEVQVIHDWCKEQAKGLAEMIGR